MTSRSDLFPSEGDIVSDLRVAVPAPLELVPADEVQRLIEQIDSEFHDMEQRAARATALADHAEERAASLGMDERGTPWAMASLHRFIGDWRAQVEAESRSILEAARIGARVRLDEARAEAARIRRARVPEPTEAARRS